MADTKEPLTKEEPPTPLDEVSPPLPEAEPKLKDSHWEVLTTSAVVEYFHTGNLVDVLSSYPWAAAVEEESYDTGNKNGGGLGDTNPLLTSPPEDLSVSLYLENEPKNILVVVTVPRWLSDGEVWEVRLTPPRCTKGYPHEDVTVRSVHSTFQYIVSASVKWYCLVLAPEKRCLFGVTFIVLPFSAGLVSHVTTLRFCLSLVSRPSLLPPRRLRRLSELVQSRLDRCKESWRTLTTA